MQVQGIVNPPSNTSAADGASPVQIMGKQADAIVSELHGRAFTANYRGKVFLTAGAAAGTTIPVSSATAATTLLYNPIGSGIIIELLRVNVGILNATTVVSGISLGLISGLLVAPTAITAGAVVPGNLGSSAVNQAVYATAATLAAAATKFYNLFSVSATSGAFPNFDYEFRGELILQPGSLVHLVGTAAQTSASLNSLAWAEWPQ